MDPEKVKQYESILCEKCKKKLPEELAKLNALQPGAGFLKRIRSTKRALTFWKFLCPKCRAKFKKLIPKVGL